MFSQWKGVIISIYLDLSDNDGRRGWVGERILERNLEDKILLQPLHDISNSMLT